jgi:S1-C subfamily serine protease
MIEVMTNQLTIAAIAGVAAVVAACGGGRPGDTVTRVAPLAAADGPTSLQQDLVGVVGAVSPSVVQIRTPEDLGSGVVFDARGDVVTNAHVVGNATRFVVTLASGDSHPATAIGRDAANDLAVIRIAGASPRAATFADSSQVAVGDIVLALGNPLGLRSSVTEGIVSAVGRSVPEGDGVGLSSAIQTSAAINPGNSGGALVDLSGRVIGVPTLAAIDPQMGAGEAPGIGFAIDGNTVRRVAASLLRSSGGRRVRLPQRADATVR